MRIETGEVEAVLRGLPVVREAAVVTATGFGGRQELRAFVVTEGTAHLPAASELAEHLRRHLPAPFLPAGYELIDRLPLTLNGKIDRAALVRIVQAERDRTGPATAVVEPAPVAPGRSETKRLLAGILVDALGPEQVSADTGFLEMGGDSLLAMRVHARATAAGIALGLRDLLEASDLADLADLVDRVGGFASPERSVPVLTTAASGNLAARVDGRQRLIRCDGERSISISELDERFRAAMVESGLGSGGRSTWSCSVGKDASSCANCCCCRIARRSRGVWPKAWS